MKKLMITLIMIFTAMTALTAGDAAEFYDLVVANALDAEGLTSVPSVDGEYFTSDCIGFVRYVYYKSGVDLMSAYGNGTRGVDSLYNGLFEWGFVFTTDTAAPGDIVFFSDTYDANDNDEWDDPLSHIGIVTSVEKHNTINYMHYSGSGIKEDQLNLSYPYTYAMRQADGELFIVNSYLRRDRGEGFDDYCYISSYFFHSFAHIPVKTTD